MEDAGRSFLKLVDTYDEEVYMSRPVTEWVSGEFASSLLACSSFNTSQISLADYFLLLQTTTTQLRVHSDMIPCRFLVQLSDHS